MKNYEIVDIPQGSPEWHALRKKKITATDASAIMKESHWKTSIQLYNEKLSNDPPTSANARMQRGNDLEPIARENFIRSTGILVNPTVVVKDWAMASLDGMSECGNTIVEIKCPGEKDHETALKGKVPNHYRSQLQHQMYVTGVKEMFYYSFDGKDGVYFKVKRDDEYIERMIVEEKKFYQNLMLLIAPEEESEYIEREDCVWEELAIRWKSVTTSLKELTLEEEEIRKKLVSLSGESNVRGCGISLCQINRKGTVDYSKIPEIQNVDLEKYRKPPSNSWRITSHA